jgi:hypothetical protein
MCVLEQPRVDNPRAAYNGGGGIALRPALGLESNAAVSRTWVNPYNNISFQQEAKHT